MTTEPPPPDEISRRDDVLPDPGVCGVCGKPETYRIQFHPGPVLRGCTRKHARQLQRQLLDTCEGSRREC